jgi:hypothetical protein
MLKPAKIIDIPKKKPNGEKRPSYKLPSKKVALSK